MPDQLRRGLKAQLEGVDIHACQLNRRELRKGGIVKGNDRNVLRYGQPQLHTGPLQNRRQNIVAGHHCGGPLLPLQQLTQGGKIAG